MSDVTTMRTDPILQRYTETCRATAYVPAPSAVEDAPARFDLHLEDARRATAEVADDATAERLVSTLRAHGHAEGRTLAAVVGEDRVHVWPMGTELPMSVSDGPLPDLGRLLAARQAWVPHAVVLVDRIGADIDVVHAIGDDIELTIEGAESHITRSQPGGWSQRRFQQRAEEHWEDNAQLVADRVRRAVQATGVELVLMSGDIRARQLLAEHLPEQITGSLVDLETGGRADDGSEAHVDDAVDAAVRREAASRRAEGQRQVLDAIGRGEGVTGRHDVLRMLFENRVDTLLVHQQSAEGIEAHFGPEPIQVAADATTLHSLDLSAQRAPLADVALRGAAGTGATVVMLVDAVADVTDGLAASLRG